jgi:hypothetical protein
VEDQFATDELTPEEISLGWHYCYNSNRELIGPGNKKMDSCKCKVNKILHKQIRKNETNNLPTRQ